MEKRACVQLSLNQPLEVDEIKDTKQNHSHTKLDNMQQLASRLSLTHWKQGKLREGIFTGNYRIQFILIGCCRKCRPQLEGVVSFFFFGHAWRREDGLSANFFWFVLLVLFELSVNTHTFLPKYFSAVFAYLQQQLTHSKVCWLLRGCTHDWLHDWVIALLCFAWLTASLTCIQRRSVGREKKTKRQNIKTSKHQNIKTCFHSQQS